MTAPHQQHVGHDGPVHGQEGLPEEDEGLKTGGSGVRGQRAVEPEQNSFDVKKLTYVATVLA